VLLGAAIFAIDGIASSPSREIVVTPAVRSDLAAQWEREHGAPPSDAELERAVATWVDDEILYREGLARGFDIDDPAVRGRIRRKMLLVLDSQVLSETPSEAELEAFFREHAEDYAEVSRIDFTHVYLTEANAARAPELLELLRGGASPNGLGDTFSGGRRYRGRALADLEQTFGPEFVEGLAEQSSGEWTLRRSRYGAHLVRVERRTGASRPELAAVRDRVIADWQNERRDAAVAAEMARLRSEWKIR
jgi:peptidyl-prolyl cis-trans isomerase C